MLLELVDAWNVVADRTAPPREAHLRASHPIALAGPWTGATVDVWLSQDGMAKRIRVASASGGTDYELGDVARAVIVSVPAPDLIATDQTPKIELAGPYRVQRRGRYAQVQWALEQAPATGGETCWRWVASVSLEQVVQDRPDGARCVGATMPSAGTASEVQFVVVGKSTASYDAVAAVLPPGVRALRIGFVGGTVTEEPVANPFVWVGPATPLPAYLGVTLHDGTQLDCGAGAISTPEDLRDDTLAGRVAGSPWACS